MGVAQSDKVDRRRFAIRQSLTRDWTRELKLIPGLLFTDCMITPTDSEHVSSHLPDGACSTNDPTQPSCSGSFRVWPLCAFSNFSLKYCIDPFALIVTTPPRASLSIANIGEHAKPSSHFSSPVLVTNVRQSPTSMTPRMGGFLVASVTRRIDETSFLCKLI